MLWNTQSYLFLGRELISCKLSEWCVWLFHTCGTRKGVPLSSPGHPATKTPLFSPKVIFAGLPGKAFPRKHAFVDISVFLWLCKQRPRFAQGQPKGYFQTKNFIEQLNWFLNECWLKGGEGSVCWVQCANMWQVAVWLLCREAQPLWKVMIHDGLNLECHGVRSHGTSSSQASQKDLLYSQSKFDPWVDILVFAKGNFCMPSHGSMPL